MFLSIGSGSPLRNYYLNYLPVVTETRQKHPVAAPSSCRTGNVQVERVRNEGFLCCQEICLVVRASVFLSFLDIDTLRAGFFHNKRKSHKYGEERKIENEDSKNGKECFSLGYYN